MHFLFTVETHRVSNDAAQEYAATSSMWLSRNCLYMYVYIWVKHAGNAVSLSTVAMHKKFFLPVRIVRARVLFAFADGCEQRAPRLMATRYAPYFSHFIRMDLESFFASPVARLSRETLSVSAMIDEIWSEKCVFPNSFQIASARGLYARRSRLVALEHKTPRSLQKAARAEPHEKSSFPPSHRTHPADSDAFAARGSQELGQSILRSWILSRGK